LKFTKGATPITWNLQPATPSHLPVEDDCLFALSAWLDQKEFTWQAARKYGKAILGMYDFRLPVFARAVRGNPTD